MCVAIAQRRERRGGHGGAELLDEAAYRTFVYITIRSVYVSSRINVHRQLRLKRKFVGYHLSHPSKSDHFISLLCPLSVSRHLQQRAM